MPATVTMSELSKGLDDSSTNESCRTVLEGVLNDCMDLTYGVETPYTTGKQIFPTGATIEDVEKAIAEYTTKKMYKKIFVRILNKAKSSDLTPQVNDGSWDTQFTPVLVLVSAKDSMAEAEALDAAYGADASDTEDSKSCTLL